MYRLPRLCTLVYTSFQRLEIIHAELELEDTELKSFLWNMSGIYHIKTSILLS